MLRLDSVVCEFAYNGKTAVFIIVCVFDKLGPRVLAVQLGLNILSSHDGSGRHSTRLAMASSCPAMFMTS